MTDNELVEANNDIPDDLDDSGKNPQHPDIKDNKDRNRYEKRKKHLDDLADMGLIDKFMDGHGNREDKQVIQRVLNGEVKYDPERLSIEIEKYFKKIDEKSHLHISASGAALAVLGKHPYTLHGLCVFLGIGVKEWKKYEKMENFAIICDRAMTRITEKQLTGAMMKDLDPGMVKFNLKNTTDMTEDGADNDIKKPKIGKITFVTIRSSDQLDIPVSEQKALEDAYEIDATEVKP
jgi:hypothetical protein